MENQKISETKVEDAGHCCHKGALSSACCRSKLLPALLCAILLFVVFMLGVSVGVRKASRHNRRFGGQDRVEFRQSSDDADFRPMMQGHRFQGNQQAMQPTFVPACANIAPAPAAPVQTQTPLPAPAKAAKPVK